MDSFYGGKQGVSFVIKAQFKYVDTTDTSYANAIAKGAKAEDLKSEVMSLCFKDPNYKQVWYGEYAIIDSDVRGDTHNGEVYRRTLIGNGTSSGDGNATSYEYIGKIEGPAGEAPYFYISSIAAANQKYKDSLKYEDVFYSWQDEQGKVHHLIKDMPESGLPTHTIGDNITKVPGREKDASGNWINKFNDDIKYVFLNVHYPEDVDGSLDWVYMGFTVPYHIFNFTAQEVNYTETVKITEDSNNAVHPYWHGYSFTIPRGIRGSQISNARLTTIKKLIAEQNASNIQNVKLYDATSVTYRRGLDSFDITKRYTIYNSGETSNNYVDSSFRNLIYPNPSKVEGTKTSTTPSNYQDIKFWVFDWTWYKKDSTATTYTCYLGNYDEIYDINVDDSGGITFYYNTHKDFYKNVIKSIKRIDLATDGTLKITWNSGDVDNIAQKIKWITGIKLAEDGTISATFNNSDAPQIPTTLGHLTWITGLSLDNSPTSSTYGKLTITENNSLYKMRLNGKEVSANTLETILPFVKKVSFDESNGRITITYMDGHTNVLQNTDGQAFELEELDSAELVGAIDSAGSNEAQDRRIKLTTTRGRTKYIGSGINFVQDIVTPRVGNEYHLYILYNDPERRPNFDKVAANAANASNPPSVGGNFKLVSKEAIEGTTDRYRICTYQSNGTVNGVTYNQETWWTNNITGSDGTDYGKKVFWQDMGCMRNFKQGALITGYFKDVEAEAYNSNEQALYDLQTKYPNGEISLDEAVNKVLDTQGLTTAEKAFNNNATGQIITTNVYSQVDNDRTDTYFYAYDYLQEHSYTYNNTTFTSRWFLVGTMPGDLVEGITTVVPSINRNIMTRQLYLNSTTIKQADLDGNYSSSRPWA